MSVLEEQGYNKTYFDSCVSTKKFFDDDFIVLLLYVEDMVIIGKNTSQIDSLKKQYIKSYTIKDLGPKQIPDIRITKDRDLKKLFLSQKSTLRKFYRSL